MREAAERERNQDRAIRIGLVAAIYAVYAQTADFDFVNFGDPQYVYENARVLAGLSRDGVRWAFGAVVAGQWGPLTLLSHMADAQMFGLRAGMHHFMSVMLHMVASLLLYAGLKRASGARWPSAFVAFGFALHPLQVESVAWVAERKNVLGALCWFSGVYLYVLYCERPGRGRFLAVAAAFAAGLLATPLMVTFPCALLLLDLWPLERLEWRRALKEKRALLAMSVAALAAALALRVRSGAAPRFEDAFPAYVRYLRQMVWPAGLAVFYPEPRTGNAGFAAVAAVAALAALVAVSVLAARQWRARPWLAMGWFWFLATLTPAMGRGMQGHADHAMYIPMVGLLVMAAWGAREFLPKPVLAAAGLACCAAWLALAWRQTGYWQNGETLYGQAIRVSEPNAAAEFQLGEYYGATGHYAAAIPHYEATVRMRPGAALAQGRLGTALLRTGNFAASIAHFETAVRSAPENAEWQYGLGQALFSEGKAAAAIGPFEAAIRARPNFVAAHYFRGMAVTAAAAGRVPGLMAQYERALAANPEDAAARAGLGGLWTGLGRWKEAEANVDVAQEIAPSGEMQQVLEHLRERLE